MKCKNNNCNNTLNPKQKRFCSQTCHYDWKKNQPSKNKNNRDKIIDEIRHIESLKDKDEIYKFISDNIFKFNTITNLSESERITKMINEYHFNIDNNVTSWKDLYDYLKGPIKCTNINCVNESKFNTFTHGYYKFCSDECLHKWRSYNMEGDKNNFHKVSTDVRKRIGVENGKRIKKMVAEGTFTPNITNSWAKSRCNINLNGKNIKLRSSWDAYFQLLNPSIKYEKLRIPYMWNNDWHNYIVDFIDDVNKCIYEIKPKSEQNKGLIKAKREAAIQWAIDNEYDYIEITEDWFKVNHNESILKGQPEEKRLKKLLKQFHED